MRFLPFFLLLAACPTAEPVADELGQDNCCNNRHICFPEGCYYTQP